jgi:putative ABC transport system ATP-binding protein
MSDMVRLDKVSKIYGRGGAAVCALNEVSLEVAEGEFLAVMGPSGSGKSTLLHLVAGLDAPSSGEVYLNDVPISAMSDDDITVFRRRNIGFVFQFFNLLPTLSAEENVALPLLLDGQGMKSARPKAARMLELVGLSHRRSHRPDELSGGEAQRVAIARALVFEPVLLIADEPTGNLDSRSGEEVLGLIRELAQRCRVTVMMVTHDRQAAAYGDRVVTLKDGKIAATGAMVLKAAR